MPARDRSRSAVQAAAEASTVEQARAALDEPAALAPLRGAGSQDPLVGDLRRGGLLPLLVLHFVADEPCYGNQLMDRIADLTAGALTVNPNTMYPLLRQLEARGLVQGEWEHPERRSRRFYRITEAGAEEREKLSAEVGPRLKRIARSIQVIRREIGA
jgi:DNA-binding PadR family transcriptional regulator